MRVMLDTNVLVSMIFFPSAVTREFARTLSENHRIVICDYVIEELRLVTERKFPHKTADLNQFFVELPFEMVYTPGRMNPNELPQIRDVKDSPILATAMMENVDILVTGDKDFHVLELESPAIMTMAQFVKEVKDGRTEME